MHANAQTLRVATFNASMDGSNYVEQGKTPKGNELKQRLAHGNEQQIKNVAEIIQRVRPDILLINEFDYISNEKEGVQKFIEHYLKQSQSGQSPINYPYYYVAPVNTGVPAGIDLNGDGKTGGLSDKFGFGHYPGQYGMLVLSRFPIMDDEIRTFQGFLWKDMPNNLLSKITKLDGTPWYSPQAQAILRLSSKSHWDLPVNIDGRTVHVLASHPTPPVFDGPEDRNGKRNHDEVQFWVDYLNGEGYFYDDQGRKSAFQGEQFVVLGDLNASYLEGDSFGNAIKNLAKHDKINSSFTPSSEGAKAAKPNNVNAPFHTAYWGMRADYVLPSKAGFDIKDGAVFWPTKDEETYRLISDRKASSDHRLVWLDLILK